MTNIINDLDKIYIINLKKCTSKRSNMEREISKLERLFERKINVEFIDAIDGNDRNSVSKFNIGVPNWKDPNSGKYLTNGEVGCALSHYIVWEKILEFASNNAATMNDKFLILEDDVIFLASFFTKLKDYSSEVVNEPLFDMIYANRKSLDFTGEKRLSPHVRISGHSYWTCAYILTSTGAKKLVDGNYLDNLIPVDEYIPIMYGKGLSEYSDLYPGAGSLISYSFTPSLLKLTDDAFINSDTFNSDPFNMKLNNANSKFVIVYSISPGCSDDGLDRFLRNCEIYGIVNYMFTTDEEYYNIFENIDNLDNTLILRIDIVKHFNAMVIGPDNEIISKFNRLVGDNKNKICVGYTDYKKNTNSYYLANGSCLKTHGLNKSGSNNFIQSVSESNLIVDTEQIIFMNCLYDTNFTYAHNKSRIVGKLGALPNILYVDDSSELVSVLEKSRATTNIVLNQIENYVGNGWNEYYGFMKKTKEYNNNELPSVYVSILLGNYKSVLDVITKLNYPKDKIYFNVIDNGCNYEHMHTDIQKFLETDYDYYFFIDHDVSIINEHTLQELIKLDKGIICPLVKNTKVDYWSNFWGALDTSDKVGYYKRSFDYFDILKRNKLGCWNVPYISKVFLIKRSVLVSQPNLFYDNINHDYDMRFCMNARFSNTFMYLCNFDLYAELFDPSMIEPTVDIINEEPIQNVSIYDVASKKELWEKKYLHPKYYSVLNNVNKIDYEELCPDIYNFPLFSQEFCTEIIDIMEKSNSWSGGKDNHVDTRLGKNYYENHPTVDTQLFQVGLGEQWKFIVSNYIAPVAAFLYSGYKTKDINLAFVVRYRIDEQEKLTPHHDASTYTINVALNKYGDYTGGGCRFIRQNYILRGQNVGMCCIHHGKLTAYHEGLPVETGTRYILVSFIN
jgi:GR25 family glycosyltransferase involved in LPS biosynthesis